jgi:hypothetical protein
MVKAELSYNPYLQETEVKFNGRPPRINSLIEKFQNKRLQEWIKDIPSIFHDEMNGYNFDLVFKGTVMDFQELEKSFIEANVSKKQIHLVFSKEMESRIIKTVELDEALEWLEQNRNRVLDYDQFKSDNDELLFGAFPFVIIKGNVKAISLYDNLKIEPENVASVDELKNTDLHNTPVLFYLDHATLPSLQHELSELLKRSDISQNQIFFYIAPSLRKGMVKRIIRDLAVENPQIVDSLQEECIKQYFEMFPISDYISDTIRILRNKTNEISEQLAQEDQKRQEENKEKYELIHECERNITALKEAEELFTNQESSDLDSSWVEAEDKLIGQISKWQARRTKATGEVEGNFWAEEFDKLLSKSFNEFTQSLWSSFFELREKIKNDYYLWYQRAGVDTLYNTSDITCGDFAIGIIPPIKEELLKMKEENYVTPKEDNILGFIFNTQQKPQPETVLEISYFLQKWREYAEDIAGKRADQLINQAKEILTKYKNDLTERYIEHITFLISQETEKKDQVIATLSEEERLLQNDMNWLHEIEDKLTRVERE